VGEFVLNLCRSGCRSTCRRSLVSCGFAGTLRYSGAWNEESDWLSDLLRLFEEALIQMSI